MPTGCNAAARARTSSDFSSSCRDRPYPLFASIVVVPSSRKRARRTRSSSRSVSALAARTPRTLERMPPPARAIST
jgi:hypothetical protein